MGLIETYRSIKPAIVAIVDRVKYSQDGSTPRFADVLGTGFFVDQTGIVATNRHIVEELMRLPLHPVTGRRTGAIIAFGEPTPTESGGRMPTALLEIDNLTACNKRIEIPGWYGSEILDIGFIQVKASQTPALHLASEAGTLVCGREVAMAGFPMGTDALVFFAEDETGPRLRQVSPTLRRGIIASLLPYDFPNPHGFTIDVMTQGGASGSPVFATEIPEVLGVIASGPDVVNSTTCEPAAFIKRNLVLYKQMNSAKTEDFPLLRDQFNHPMVSPQEVWQRLNLRTLN
jgi:hypothetical protein